MHIDKDITLSTILCWRELHKNACASSFMMCLFDFGVQVIFFEGSLWFEGLRWFAVWLHFLSVPQGQSTGPLPQKPACSFPPDESQHSFIEPGWGVPPGYWRPQEDGLGEPDVPDVFPNKDTHLHEILQKSKQLLVLPWQAQDKAKQTARFGCGPGKTPAEQRRSWQWPGSKITPDNSVIRFDGSFLVLYFTIPPKV